MGRIELQVVAVCSRTGIKLIAIPYKTIKQNAINMAMRLREGHYTKAALDQIVKQVM